MCSSVSTDSFRSVSRWYKKFDSAADSGSSGCNRTAMFGSFLGKPPEVGFGNCLSAIRNVLHGPGLSWGFSSFRSNLEVKPQEKTVQQFGLQSMRHAALFVVFSWCNFLSFLLRSSYLGASLDLEAQCWMRRRSLLCPNGEEGVSAYPSQEKRRSLSCCSKGTEAVQKQSRSRAFTYSTFILNKAKIS